ncbi:MAG: HAD family hydrolase [Lachnospiraceae bacterium]|nr:HAD family hydrolase [Lachnospiraceae bacterium]
MKKGIIFDLDGTLWDSAQAVVDSWNVVIDSLPDFHKKITVEDMESLMGKTMDDIAFTYFNTVSRDRALEILQACMDYENEYLEKVGGILYPQLEQVLADLSKDYFLAIVSNCQRGYIEAFLKFHKLEPYFNDFECFGNTKQEKDANITTVVKRNGLSKAVYVGDVLGDYLSTTKAGLPFIWAEYGFGQVPQAKYKINALTQLRTCIEESEII